MSLDFPLLVRSRNFCFFLSRRGERGRVFAAFLPPFPEKGILDFIPHRPIIQVLTVPRDKFSCTTGIVNQQNNPCPARKHYWVNLFNTVPCSWRETLPDTIDREICHRKSETIAWNHHSLRPPLNSKEKLTNKVKKE